MRDLELELMIANEELREANETFAQLRKEYHSLRMHTDMLEEILRAHELPFPLFWGW